MHDSTVVPIWIGTAKYAQSSSYVLAAMRVVFLFLIWRIELRMLICPLYKLIHNLSCKERIK